MKYKIKNILKKEYENINSTNNDNYINIDNIYINKNNNKIIYYKIEDFDVLSVFYINEYLQNLLLKIINNENLSNEEKEFIENFDIQMLSIKNIINETTLISNILYKKDYIIVNFNKNKIYYGDCFNNKRELISIKYDYNYNIIERYYSRLKKERLYHYSEKQEGDFTFLLKYEINLNWNYIPRQTLYNLHNKKETLFYKNKDIENFIKNNDINPFYITDKELKLFNLKFKEELDREQTKIP